MARRVTIMISDDLDKRVRIKQSKLIQKLNITVSYSSVISDVLCNNYKL